MTAALPAGLPGGVRGRVLAVGMLLVLVAALWLGVVAPLLAWHGARQETLMQRRALADRMEVVVASLPRLRRDVAGSASGPQPRALLEGTSDALAGAALQGQLEALAGGSGITVSSAELLPVEPDGAYRRIRLRLTVAGPWPAVVRLLQSIQEASPRMLVDDLQMQPSPSVTAGAMQPLGSTFTVIAFRSDAAG